MPLVSIPEVAQLQSLSSWYADFQTAHHYRDNDFSRHGQCAAAAVPPLYTPYASEKYHLPVSHWSPPTYGLQQQQRQFDERRVVRMSHYGQMSERLNGSAKWPSSMLDAGGQPGPPVPGNGQHHPALTGYKTAFSAFHQTNPNSGLLLPTGYRPPGVNGGEYPSHYNPQNLPPPHHHSPQQASPGGARSTAAWQGVKLPTISQLSPQQQQAHLQHPATIHLPLSRQHHSPQQQHHQHSPYLISSTSGGPVAGARPPIPYYSQVSPHQYQQHQAALQQQRQQQQQWLHSPQKLPHHSVGGGGMSAFTSQSTAAAQMASPRGGGAAPPTNANTNGQLTPLASPPRAVIQQQSPSAQQDVYRQQQQQFRAEEVTTSTGVTDASSQQQTPTKDGNGGGDTPGLSVSTTADSCHSHGQTGSSTVTPPSPKYQQISPASSVDKEDGKEGDTEVGGVNGKPDESAAVSSSTGGANDGASTPVLNVVDQSPPAHVDCAQDEIAHGTTTTTGNNRHASNSPQVCQVADDDDDENSGMAGSTRLRIVELDEAAQDTVTIEVDDASTTVVTASGFVDRQLQSPPTTGSTALNGSTEKRESSASEATKLDTHPPKSEPAALMMPSRYPHVSAPSSMGISLLPASHPLAANSSLSSQLSPITAAGMPTSSAFGQPTMAQMCDPNYATSLRIQEKIRNEALGIGSPPSAGGGGQSQSALRSLPPLTRPPGLGPPPQTSQAGGVMTSRNGGGGPTVYTCPICGFSSASKFHFNSHMNTHTDHQCSMCDYTSRTEGRLKRHMKEFHTDEQRAAAGVGDSLETSSSRSSLLDDSNSSMTMVPPVTMVSSSSLIPSHPLLLSPTASRMSLDDSPTNLRHHQQTSSALEQIQALTAQTQREVVGISNSLLGDLTRDQDSRSGAGSTGGSGGAGGSGGGGTGSKPKHYKCKQCGLVSVSKDESWAHARTHIPADKQLVCPQCPFVTEYKHHLEYHLRNHFGQKPFQCKKCNYSCVNKSMLNSHMKSHSNVYQYRCMNCTYATKYCHSLKLHLKKYAHTAAAVIQPDGTRVDPTAHLDLHGGNRRMGARRRSASPPPTRVPHPDPHRALNLDHLSPQFLSPQQQQQHHHQSVVQMGAFGGRPTPSATGHHHPGVAPPPPPGAAQGLAHFLQMQQQQRQQLEAAAMMSRIATFGVQLPAIPSTSNTQGLGLPTTTNIAAAMASSEQRMAEQHHQQQQTAAAFKCKLCPYQAPSGDELIKHNLQHVMEQQPELASLYGLYGAGRRPRDTPLTSATGTPTQLMAQPRRGSLPIGDTETEMKEEEEGEDRAAGVQGAISYDQSPGTADGSHISTGSPVSVKGSSDESGEQPATTGGGSSRRKGKALRLDQIAKRLHQVGGKPGSPAHSGSSANDDGVETADAAQTAGESFDGEPPAKRPALNDEGNDGKDQLSPYDQQQPQRRSASFTAVIREANEAQQATPTTVAANAYAVLSAAIQQSEQNRMNALARSNQQTTANGSPGRRSIGVETDRVPDVPSDTPSAAAAMAFTCTHCRIGFEEAVMYHIHMGYHGYDDPFKCNRCGLASADKLSFNMHLIQGRHD